jgi:hypothetical protein
MSTLLEKLFNYIHIFGVKFISLGVKDFKKTLCKFKDFDRGFLCILMKNVASAGIEPASKV